MPSEGKIKSKDLSYDSSLPPFLQRLHAQKAGRGDSDRHERQIARPKRAKDPNDDDGPTVIDESGDMVSKEDYEKLTKAEEGGEGVEENGTRDAAGKDGASGEPSLAKASNTETSRLGAKAIDGTATKKRKAAKVIGGESDDHDADAVKSGSEEKDRKDVKKAKRKAKPIKLAFEDGDET